jgi:hypothetical protein
MLARMRAMRVGNKIADGRPAKTMRITAGLVFAALEILAGIGK